MPKKNGSRHGKHKDSKVLLGGMVEPFMKAVALVTAAVWAKDGRKLSQTDMLWIGVSRLAQQVGILDADGKVTPEFADAVTLAEESVVSENRASRGSRGGKRQELKQ